MNTRGIVLLGALGAYVVYSIQKGAPVAKTPVGTQARKVTAPMPQSPYGGYATGQATDAMGNIIYGNSGLPPSTFMQAAQLNDSPNVPVLDTSTQPYTGGYGTSTSDYQQAATDAFVGPLQPDLTNPGFFDNAAGTV
jgi:hypothetical protein